MTTLTKIQTVVLNVSSFSEHIIDGQKTLQAIVPTSEFLHKDIPNKANSREFTGFANKSVREMISTLKSEPDMFRLKNLGIRLVASDYTKNGDELTLYFDSDEGIFNGGHTFNVLQKHGRKSAHVLVNVDLNIAKEKLVEISIALNMSKRLEEISKGEKMGRFDWVKKVLNDESIIYKEGDEGEHVIDDVLKVANLFTVVKGRQYGASAINQSIKHKRNVVVKNNKDENVLLHTKYILPDAWELFKILKEHPQLLKLFPEKFMVKKERRLWDGLCVILLASCRYMTTINKNGIPVWKEGYDVHKAEKQIIQLAKGINRILNRNPYKSLETKGILESRNFHNEAMLHYANTIN